MEKNYSTLLRFSDYCAAMLTGTLTAFLVHLAIGDGWPMFLGMFAGMALGTVSLLVAIIIFARFGGIFEIVMPGMLITMLVGMAGGMWVTAGSPFRGELLIFGLLSGLYIQSLFHLWDRSLHGELPCGENK